MNLITVAVKHLMIAGVTGDALLLAIKEMEDAQIPLRSKGAVRQERYRERNKASQVTNRYDCDADKSAHIENAPAPDSLFLPSEVILKKERKKERKKVSKITASRFSLDALPSEWKSFCELKRPDLDPQTTFDAFRDWWAAAPGPKGLKADWAATWRTWVRNQKPNTDKTQALSKIPHETRDQYISRITKRNQQLGSIRNETLDA